MQLLQLQVAALASQVPRDLNDEREVSGIATQAQLAVYSQNTSWSQEASLGGLGLFTDGGAHQLFASTGSSNLTVYLNGSVYFALAPDRYGLVLFRTVLRGSGDVFFKCRKGVTGSASSSANSTDPHDFLLLVRPVNDPPSFNLAALASAPIQVREDEVIRIDHFAINISNGGWAEEDQAVTFMVNQVAGLAGLFKVQQVECLEGRDKPCASGSAGLYFIPSENRFGEASYTLQMKDSGGTARGGTDTSIIHSFSVKMWPENDPPSFALATSDVITLQDTRCLGSLASGSWVSPQLDPSCRNLANHPSENQSHVHAGFAINIDMGPNENGPLPGGGDGITRQGECSIGPCEHQSGTFVVEALDAVEAQELLAALPAITPQGVLEFETRRQVTGEARFRVRLEDSGSIDISTLPSPKMDPTGTYVLADAPGRICEQWHSNAFCDAARQHDQQRLDDIKVLASATVLSSPDLYFTIKVIRVNRPPSFDLLARVEVPEDFGPFQVQAASNLTTDNSTSNTEPDQRLNFVVTTNYSQMFAPGGEPDISAQGLLQFQTAQDAFGPVELYVTLRDDGGTEDGGRDYSETLTCLVVVSSVNDVPFFQLAQPMYEFVENQRDETGFDFISVPGFTTMMRAGPPNEMCTALGPYCLMQRINYRLLDMDAPTLFDIQPRVDVDSSYVSTLILSITPGLRVQLPPVCASSVC